MRRWNLGAIGWSLTMLAIATSLIWLLLPGRLIYYLAIEHRGSLAIAVALLLLLSLVSIRRWRAPTPARPWPAQLLFLLPLLLGLAFPHNASLGQLGDRWSEVPPAVQSSLSDQVPLPTGTLVITADNFLPMMELLWSAGELIDGREVEMVGFVHSQPGLGPQDFVLARLLVSCCREDAEVAGLLCRWADRQNLADGEWVEVRGKLGRLPYFSMQSHQVADLPFIQVEQLTAVAKPESEYIIP